MRISLILSLALPLLCTTKTRADWPQWRGPDRNGIASTDITLPDQLGEETILEKVWEFDGIPSDKMGGHSSPVVADGRAILSVVWHRDEPTTTRRIDAEVLSALGYRSTNSLAPETIATMETARMNLSRRLRGAALDEWAEKWVEENIDPKTQLSLGAWIISRFKKGPSAIPLEVFDTLRKIGKREFADLAELQNWIGTQNFGPEISTQILKAVPATKKAADDVILCFDVANGEKLWEFRKAGSPSGRSSSSTPTIHEGHVFAALSDHLYCVDLGTGGEIWRSPLAGRKGPASSPLFSSDHIYLQHERLSCFDATNGELVWENLEIKGSNASPVSWEGNILCNTKKSLVAADHETGTILWEVPGGGDGTPVVRDDIVVISSRLEQKNLIAYRLFPSDPPRELWSKSFLARRYGATPIIWDGHVYHLGSSRHLCVELLTGETMWDRESQSSISSPFLADGKLLIYENRGGVLGMIKADPQEYQHLGRSKLGALYCASPCPSGDHLIVRTPKSISALRAKNN